MNIFQCQLGLVNTFPSSSLCSHWPGWGGPVSSIPDRAPSEVASVGATLRPPLLLRMLLSAWGLVLPGGTWLCPPGTRQRAGSLARIRLCCPPSSEPGLWAHLHFGAPP